MADARKDKRTLLSLKIRYKSATLEDFIERYSSDISQGGVFIKAKKPLDVGTLLKFEFLLQDQSTLIHGVGRVVWRRDPSEAHADQPAGMGIKFIKMDPQSRALVQRIVEGRDTPGVFERVEASQHVPVSEAPVTPVPDDRTKVRHVSEFLASAFEEGGAGEAAVREAQAGAQRAREISKELGSNRAAPVRGALGSAHDGPSVRRQTFPEAASRSAMSAFGRGNGSVSQAMAEPLEELDAEDDFLDHDTTRIHDYPDAGATVVAGASGTPQMPERRPTPVVPTPRSRLETEVPDLFGPDLAQSFEPPGALEPAPGQIVDSSLLDPAVPTVPPPAGVPAGPGIPVEAFRAPTERAPAAENPYDAPDEDPPSGTGGSKRSLRRALLLLALLVVVAGAVAAWQLGYLEPLKELAAPYFGDEIEVVEARPVVAATPTPAVEEPDLDLTGEDETGDAVAEDAPTNQEAAEAPTAAPKAGLAKVVVLTRPARAFVSVDGKAMGRSPVTLHLKPGKEVAITARVRGYLPKTERLTVEPGNGELKLALPTLPYFVEVTSDPPGARAVAVGGGEITTPGEMRFRSMINPRAIAVSKDGFETVTKTVTRRDFQEETRRMVTSIRVTLPPEGVASAQAEPVEAASDRAAASEGPSAAEGPTAAPASPTDLSETSDGDAP